MARSSGSEKRKKVEALLVRMEPDLAEKLRKAAAARRISGAQWARNVMSRALGRKSKAPRPMSADPDLLRRLAEIATSLGRQSGALIQVAKTVREGRVSSELKREAEETLRAARETQAKLLVELARLAK